MGHALQKRSLVTTRVTSYDKGHELVTHGFNHQTRASDDQTRATICHVLPHTHIE